MSLFYDPKTKKPQVWVIGAFILVPILIMLIFYVLGQSAMKKQTAEPEKIEEPDIFNSK